MQNSRKGGQKQYLKQPSYVEIYRQNLHIITQDHADPLKAMKREKNHACLDEMKISIMKTISKQIKIKNRRHAKKGSGRLTFRSSRVKLLPPGKESCFFLFSRLQSLLSLSTLSTLLLFLFPPLQSRTLTCNCVGGSSGLLLVVMVVGYHDGGRSDVHGADH